MSLFRHFYVHGHIAHVPKPPSFFLLAKSVDNYPIDYTSFKSIFACRHFSSQHLQNDREKKRADLKISTTGGLKVWYLHCTDCKPSIQVFLHGVCSRDIAILYLPWPVNDLTDPISCSRPGRWHDIPVICM